MKIITILTVFCMFLYTASSVEKKEINMKDIVIDDEFLSQNSKKSLDEASKNKYDIMKNGIYVDQSGELIKNVAFAKNKQLREKKLSDVNSNVLYLQSIYYINSKKWGFKLNDILIDSDVNFHINGITKLAHVDPKFIRFTLLEPDLEMVVNNKDVKLQNNGDYTIDLRINEFFNLNTYKIESGNILDKYKDDEKKPLVSVSVNRK